MKTNITLFASEELTSQPFKESLINSIANTVIAGIKQGNTGALETYAKSKFMSAICEKIAASQVVKDGAAKEINDLHREERTYNGAAVGITTAGTRYDYSAIPLHKQLTAALKALETVAKTAYDTNTPQAYLDSTTGETIVITPSMVTKKLGNETPTISFK